MKIRHFFIVLFLFICFTGYAQTENPDSKNLTKEEKKAMRKAKKEEDKRKREEALNNFKEYAKKREWVVETYMVFDKQGQSYQMDPSTNFVSVAGEETTIQLSFNGIMGWNGVGGITLEGKIGKYEHSGDSKSVNITMTAMGSGLGIVDIFLSVTGDGNGRVTVSGNWGDRITFQGKFVSLEESSVFKGTPTY
jgi:hypothetical protein